MLRLFVTRSSKCSTFRVVCLVIWWVSVWSSGCVRFSFSVCKFLMVWRGLFWVWDFKLCLMSSLYCCAVFLCCWCCSRWWFKWFWMKFLVSRFCWSSRSCLNWLVVSNLVCRGRSLFGVWWIISMFFFWVWKSVLWWWILCDDFGVGFCYVVKCGSGCVCWYCRVPVGFYVAAGVVWGRYGC
jgi:hypothetical protein